MVYDIFNSWTTKCAECLTLERFLQTVAKAVKHTHTLVLFLTLHQWSFLLPRGTVSGMLLNLDVETDVETDVWI